MAVRKANQKLEKAEQRKAKKQRDQEAKEQKREEAKAAKEGAAAAAAEKGEGGEAVAKETTKRKRRTPGEIEVTEGDPLVLQKLSKFAGGAVPVCDTVKAMIEQVAAAPHLPCVAHLRRGAFKKVLEEGL